MELRAGNFIKATVNGRKAGFVVYSSRIWLLSYTSAWNGDSRPDELPMHGFFKAACVGSIPNATMTFQAWRNAAMDIPVAVFQTLGITSVCFPGEEGYERPIRRRRTSATAQPNAESEREEEVSEQLTQQVVNERPDINFYLPNYRTDVIYRGINGYHASHRVGFLNQPVNSFTGYRIGVELEVEANSGELHNEIIDQTSNWFTRECDGSLGDFGIEFITVPLLPSDAKSYTTWQPLCAYLTEKARSWDTRRCGLHVHIGREILGESEAERQMTLGKLLIFYQSEIEKWVHATAVFGRSQCYHQPNGDTDEINAVKLLGIEVLQHPSVYSKVDTAMKNKFRSSRYYAINLQNTHTIEFRKGRGSINADRIIAIVTMAEAICLFAKATEPQNLTLSNFIMWLRLNVPCGNPVYRYLNITGADV